MTNEVKPMKITNHDKMKYERNCGENIEIPLGIKGTRSRISGNSVKVNFGEHLNLFMRNKGTAVNFSREQGNMHPLGGPKQCILVSALPHSLKKRKKKKTKKQKKHKKS